VTITRHGRDAIMRCNRMGCILTRRASELGLPANVRGAAFRAAIAKEGWTSRRVDVPPDEDSRVATRMEDFCPAHAADVGGTTDEDWGHPGDDSDEVEEAARRFRLREGRMPFADRPPPPVP
jgi:hypothetical protein